MIATRPLAVLALLGALALPSAAQDDPAPPPVPAPAPAAQPETEPATETPAEGPIEFGTDLDAARAEAKAASKPLLVVAIPDWYESPMWTRVTETALVGDAAKPLEAFVRVLLRESRDREVHVRHRVPFAGYPLAVVLGPDGTYLGHDSGLPGDGDVSAWPARLGAIPPRAAQIAALRSKLDASPEDADVLFELGRRLAQAGENERADALFVRMERADPLAPAERLGEARYLRMRHAVVGLMEAKKFADVEQLCLKWRRRFEEHARIADVLLLQANARYLANRHDDAKELWQRIVTDHTESDAGKAAKRALDEL